MRSQEPDLDRAPLIGTAEAPVPEGAEASWVRGAGGARLRAARFPPARRARGSVVVSGGRTEPIEKYFEVIEELRARGFAVLAHDWRGQGLSHRALPDRLRGHADGHDELVGDLAALIERYQAHLPRPRIALGHSMGACVTLLALASGLVEQFDGCALVAPMLRVRTAPVPHALAALLARGARLLGLGDRYVPGRRRSPLDEPFEGNALTHDRARWDRHKRQLAACRELALGGPTWGWLDTALRASALAARPERLRRVTIPVLLCAAGEDRVVDSEAARAAARHLPNGRFVLIRRARHEILMETDEHRAAFWRALDALAAEVAPPT